MTFLRKAGEARDEIENCVRDESCVLNYMMRNQGTRNNIPGVLCRELWRWGGNVYVSLCIFALHFALLGVVALRWSREITKEF